MTQSAENHVLTFFNFEYYRTYNVEIAKIIGMEEAIILNELVSQYEFFDILSHVNEGDSYD